VQVSIFLFLCGCHFQNNITLCLSASHISYYERVCMELLIACNFGKWYALASECVIFPEQPELDILKNSGSVILSFKRILVYS
jgi:hypothetical protein